MSSDQRASRHLHDNLAYRRLKTLVFFCVTWVKRAFLTKTDIVAKDLNDSLATMLLYNPESSGTLGTLLTHLFVNQVVNAIASRTYKK